MKPVQKIFSAALALALVTLVQMTALARGFSGSSFSNSPVSFAFGESAAVVVYGGDVYASPDYDEIWPGSSIYIPVHILNESDGTSSIAADSDIKDNEVTLSYKVLQGEMYIDSISLVSSQKEKIKDLDSGVFAKIAINNLHMGIGRTELNLKLVLSVKKIAYPDTQTELEASLYNKLVDVGENTVYSAQSPAQYYAVSGFSGTPTFDFGGGIRYTAKVTSKNRYYLNLNRADQPEISRAFPDAYLEFYDFRGDMDAFSATGVLEIPVTRASFAADKEEPPKVYVYEIIGSRLNTLESGSTAFDAAKNILTINTVALGNYVLSSLPLTRDVEAGEEQILYSGYADSAEVSEGEIEVRESTLTDNINTGAAISASNVNAINPLTADTRPFISVLLLLMLSGVVVTGVFLSVRRDKTSPQ